MLIVMYSPIGVYMGICPNACVSVGVLSDVIEKTFCVCSIFFPRQVEVIPRQICLYVPLFIGYRIVVTEFRFML